MKSATILMPNDKSAMAIIDTIIVKKSISQGAEGNVFIVNTFEARYRFSVNDKIFLGNERLGENPKYSKLDLE